MSTCSTFIKNIAKVIFVLVFILEEVPLEGVQGVVLVHAYDGGQRLVQVPRLKLQRPRDDVGRGARRGREVGGDPRTCPGN